MPEGRMPAPPEREPDEGERILAALRDVARSEAISISVRGGSMEPAIRPGARLEVRRQRRYLPGDVLVFADAGGLLTVHRLLGPLPRGRLLTQGDAAARPDDAVPRERLVGRIVGGDCAPDVYRIPLAGRARALLRWAAYGISRVGSRRGG